MGRLSAGTATNIIPDRAELCGTIRTLSPEMQEKARAAVTRIAHGTAAAYGAKASVSFDSNSYAPLYNDPDMCAYAKQAVQAALGNHAFREVDSPSMAAEDFAFYLRQVAGAFLWLGIRRPGGDPPPLHSPRFDFNDAVLPAGIQVWISLAGAFPKTD